MNLLEEDLSFYFSSPVFQPLQFQEEEEVGAMADPIPSYSPKREHDAISSSATTDESEEEQQQRTKKRRSSPAAADVGSSSNPTPQRRLWVKDRSSAWWDRVSQPDFPDADFRREFRMSRSTFEFLCAELSPAVAKEDTTLRAAIPVRRRVAVCLFRLATGEPLRLVSKRFGLGISTCHKLILEVCSAIRSLLMPKFLTWPTPTPTPTPTFAGIPNVVGALYTTHIPIIAPKENVSAYFNRRHTGRNHKTSYSVTLQGVVGPDGVFTDVCIGWPGSMPDEQVLEKSALFRRAAAGMLDRQYVVGGASYPLLDWTLVPYSHKNLTWTQHAFNERVGAARDVARGAFARLKGRWRCLQKRTEVKLQDLPVVLGACCVLHNICEMRKEEMGPEQMEFELADDEMLAENAVRSVSAVQARDCIAHNLLHSGIAGNTLF